MNTKDKKYEEAKAKFTVVKDFYTHLIVYIVINLMLFTINMLTAPENLWFIWPLMGWGVAVVLQALNVFAGMFDKNWEEKQIASLMDKE